MSTGPLPWISLQYVASHEADVVRTVARTRATAVVLDLEDFIPFEHKPAARQMIAQATISARNAQRNVIVRINRPLELAVADIRAAVSVDVDAIMVPKVASADHIRLLDEYLGSLETEFELTTGKIKIIPMIETLAAVSQMEEIAASTDRAVGLVVGTEDLASQLCVRPSSPTIISIKQRMIICARRAKLLPIGHIGSAKDADSPGAYRAKLLESRELGFRAATCLNADQADLINEVYSPDATETDLIQRAVRDSMGFAPYYGTR